MVLVILHEPVEPHKIKLHRISNHMEIVAEIVQVVDEQHGVIDHNNFTDVVIED